MNKNKTKKFFIDMDGVLARWTTGSSIEEVKSPGFFLNLEAEVTLIEVVLELVRQGYSVSILSHVFGPRAASEKSSWLEDNGLGSTQCLSLIKISEPTRLIDVERMPSSA